MNETLAHVGEFGLIRRIRDLLKARGAAGTGLIFGAGDDTAAMTPRPGHDILATCDAMVEGRHFVRSFMSPREIGRRAMAVNVSDIAAMGGFPRWALVSLGLDANVPVKEVLETYEGILDQLNPLNAVVAGGNITRCDGGSFIDITLIGEVETGRMVKRAGARPGDAILVTGYPGQAAAGLGSLVEEPSPSAPEALPLIRAYRTPTPRIPEGQAIAATGLANAMIDTSDGFLGDLAHVCEESGTGVEIMEDALPVSGPLTWYAGRKGVNPQDLVLGESDDYELIFTCAPMHVEALKSAIARVSDLPVSNVGWMTDEPGRFQLTRLGGGKEDLKPKGWDHFING